MTMGLLRVIDTIRAVREDTQIWAHHLTGEGHTTVRRQREAVARALAAVPLTRLTRAYERVSRPEEPAQAATRGRRPVLITR